MRFSKKEKKNAAFLFIYFFAKSH